MKGFENRFSSTLIYVMILLVVSGFVACLISGLANNFAFGFAGFVMLLMALCMMKGFKGPDQSKSKKAWILTFLKAPTEVVVMSDTLVLDWPIDIVGFIEVEMGLETHNYTAEKKLKCREGYLIAEATLSYRPDGADGEKLFQYISSGGKANVIKQIEGSLTAWLQAFVQLPTWEDKSSEPSTFPTVTADWMENNSLKISEYIKERLMGESGAHDESGEDVMDNNSLDDIRNLGINIENFVLFLTPPEEVINARNDRAVQQAKQEARMANSVGFNKQLKRRAVLYRGRGARPDKEDQQQILDENLIVDGKLTGVINRGGVTVTKTP